VRSSSKARTLRRRTLRCLGCLAVSTLALWTVETACVIPIGTSSETADGAAADAGPPLPKGTWKNITSNLGSYACASASVISVEPDGTTLIAGFDSLGLWSNSVASSTWQALGANSPTVPIENRPVAIVYDPKNPQHFWESGIYGMEGVYETTDNGQTFVQLGTVGDQHHCDLVSIDFTDANRATLVAGGHEEAQSLFLSTNGGMTWTSIGAGLPTNTFCTLPLVLGPHTFLVGCNYFLTPPSGVWLSTDTGTTWAQVTDAGGQGAPLVASDGSIYWASPEQGALAKGSTTDPTQWATVGKPDVVLSITPLELPNKQLATIANQVGNQYGPLYVQTSADGNSWTPVSSALPISVVSGFAYSSQRNAFYVVNETCPDAGGTDAGGSLGAFLEYDVDAGHD
jgi:hypothetical protein